MTDANYQNISSPSSSSSSSSSSESLKIRIKPSISKTSIVNRRSQRRRTHVQSPMRSSSLATTILHEKGPMAEFILDTSTNLQPERPTSSVPKDELLFTTRSTTNSKAPYWLVDDRESEWYKLSIPVVPVMSNDTKLTVPFRKLSNTDDRKESNSKATERIDRPTDTAQLIMKAVMHELDYDMDDDDQKFLDELNQSNPKKRQLTEEEFENAIIILEFSAAEKIRSHLKQKSCESDDIVCDICLVPDSDDGNEMVFCERCNCCVHQNCYGISTVPSGTWLCQPCSILRRPACILCPKLGGPMKSTASGTIWCHLTCALWLPELKFVDCTRMEPVSNLQQISHARWSLRCVVCSTTNGACVQCAHKNCRTPFHVTCGLSAGYFLGVQQTPSKESKTSRSQFNAFCLKHSEEARKHSEETEDERFIRTDDDDSLSSSSSLSTIPLTVYRREQLKNEQWTRDYQKNFSTWISSTHLHQECPQEFDEKISKKIYDYWINKRQMNKTRPLIKRIDYVLEQRENAELLITQIETCLKIRQKMLQLQARSKSAVDSLSTVTLTQRFESLKKTFSSSSSINSDHRRRHRSSSTLHGENEAALKLVKRRRGNLFYSTEQYRAIERAKQCTVTLESTYRQHLKSDTTYLIGETIEGQMILLPKHLIEQVTTIDKDTSPPPIDYSDISGEDEIEPIWKRGTFKAAQTAYTSQGNVVTCTTGSFD